MLSTSIVHLSLTRGQVLNYYRGVVKNVKAYDTAGQYLFLPIEPFLKYVSHDGIHGTFKLIYRHKVSPNGGDKNAKLVNIEKI